MSSSESSSPHFSRCPTFPTATQNGLESSNTEESNPDFDSQYSQKKSQQNKGIAKYIQVYTQIYPRLSKYQQITQLFVEKLVEFSSKLAQNSGSQAQTSIPGSRDRGKKTVGFTTPKMILKKEKGNIRN